jgi:hypothetical protein
LNTKSRFEYNHFTNLQVEFVPEPGRVKNFRVGRLNRGDDGVEEVRFERATHIK